MSSLFSPRDLIGTIIANKYEITRLIAQGGMGVVYEAKQRDINRRVALKVLHPDISKNAEYASRFLTEARAANEARHRNIVEITDFGREGDFTYLVMEFLDGATLRHWREALPGVSVEIILRALIPVGRALHFAHDRGFVHRDVKPENILLVREPGTLEPVAKLIDFGIAKSNMPNERLTRSGTTLGTPMYMAPEQVGGAKHASPAADQYSFACVLYEAITEKAPYAAKSLPQLMAAKVQGEPMQAHLVSPRVSAELSAVVTRSLRTNPADRWSTIGALCDELERFAGTQPIPFVDAAVGAAPRSIEPTIDDQASTRLPSASTQGGAAKDRRDQVLTKDMRNPVAVEMAEANSEPHHTDSLRPAQLDLESRPPQTIEPQIPKKKSQWIPILVASFGIVFLLLLLVVWLMTPSLRGLG